MPSLDEQLLQELVGSGRLAADQAAEIVKEQKLSGSQLGRLLLVRGVISEEDYARRKSRQLKIPYVDVESLQPDPEVITLISEKTCMKLVVVALDRPEGELMVAMDNPGDLMAVDELARECKISIRPVLGSRSAILRKVAEYQDHFKTKMVEKLLGSVADQGKVLSRRLGLVIKDLESVAVEDTVVRLVNLSILNALLKRASDIHFCPGKEQMTVFYRVDGILTVAQKVSMDLHPPVINRLKIMAQLDISEKRLPQDGAFHINIEGRDIDFRVASTPTSRGEKMVLRVLDKSSLVVGLGHLGFSDGVLSDIRRHIFRPNGIILIVGPTGSGKTTTLYAALEALNSGEMNITTLEDPVEYQVDGLTQIQMHADIGLDFASALRSVLRQDPDVVLVGEIRDLETARIAIQASLTGHLVFGTLHTNDAASAVTRLVDMGAEPYLIASSLRAVVSQRLVRMICGQCRKEIQATDLEKKLMEKLGLPGDKVFRGTGCRVCFNTGYKGRTVLSELLNITDGVRASITGRKTSVELGKAARAEGMTDMFQDGLKKVREGVTSLEELLQAIDTEETDNREPKTEHLAR